MRLLQVAMRHSDPRMTHRYEHIIEERRMRVIEAVRRAYPFLKRGVTEGVTKKESSGKTLVN